MTWIFQVVPPGTDIEILKWAITQGPLAVVTLIVLWSYRRDFKRMQARDEEKISILTELVGRNTEAQVALRQAVDELRRMPRAV